MADTNKQFTHLHVHTEYSLLDGACRIDRIFERVKELGQTSIAITDHGAVSYTHLDVYKRQSVFRRLDALHACIWLLLFFVKITLYFSVFTQTIRRVFPVLKGHSAYYLAVAGVIGIFLATWGQAEQAAYRLQQAVILALLIWLALFRISAGRQKR